MTLRQNAGSGSTRGRYVAVAAGMIVASTMLVGSGSAQAGAGGALTVAAVASPVGTAGSQLPVHLVLDNPYSQLFCNAFEITLTVASGKRPRHQEFATGTPTAGAFTGTMTIPARWVRPGKLRYKVSVAQNCGLLENSTTYYGRSPTKGWSKAHIA
jgi:hypothetical protein